MNEIKGNLWDLAKGHILCVTTNGKVKNNGSAVMGKGIAKEVADKFPKIPQILGHSLILEGNHVINLGEWLDWTIFTFPTKHDWRDKSDPYLIMKAVDELIKEIDRLHDKTLKVYLPRPGCGNGGLIWSEVKPLLEKLDERFYIVSREGED